MPALRPVFLLFLGGCSTSSGCEEGRLRVEEEAVLRVVRVLLEGPASGMATALPLLEPAERLGGMIKDKSE